MEHSEFSETFIAKLRDDYQKRVEIHNDGVFPWSMAEMRHWFETGEEPDWYVLEVAKKNARIKSVQKMTSHDCTMDKPERV